MRKYQFTIERRVFVTSGVVVSAYGETQEQAAEAALAEASVGDVSFEDEVNRSEQRNVRIISVDGCEELT